MTPRSLFVTGGGSGLGLAVAQHAVRLGWRVAIAGRSRARLDAAARTLGTASAPAGAFALDVTDAAAVEAAISAWRPDALLCCAATLGQGSVFDALTPQRFAEVMHVNVTGTYIACRAAMRRWRETGAQGDIVTVASLAGIRGMQRFAGFGAYAASKHAVVGLTEALAIEGKPHGIRVNAVAPGTMRTAMTESLGLAPQTRPEDVAPTVLFLLDRAASGPVTGSTLEIHCNDD